MKKIICIVFLSIITAVSIDAQQKSYDLNWQSDFEQAKTMAKNQNKLILIYFTSSDASTASKKLNEDFFYTEKFKTIADTNLILVRVNAPRRSNLISEFQKNNNQKLSGKYNQKIIPTVILTDANGKNLGMIESYNYLHDTSKHYGLINKALKKRL